MNTTLVVRDGAAIVGCAAIEIYPDGALLRSVAVAQTARGHGVGERLTEAAVTLARSLRASAVYLLTTTAESYFPRFGFVQTTRDPGADGRSAVHRISLCVSRNRRRDAQSPE